MSQNCPICSKLFSADKGRLNRALKIGAPLYCGKVCAGLARRTKKTKEQKVADKKAYDAEYRVKNQAALKARKAAAYRANPNREREREYRKAHMARHVEYCRQPEYKEYKKSYDQGYRCKKFFGEYWEAAVVLLNIEKEVGERISRYEIYQQNGTLNKWITRRREYENIIGK